MQIVPKVGNSESQVEKRLKRKVKHSLPGKVNKKKKLNTYTMEKLGSNVLTSSISRSITNDGNNDGSSPEDNIIPIIAETQTRNGPLVLDVEHGEYYYLYSLNDHIVINLFLYR